MACVVWRLDEARRRAGEATELVVSEGVMGVQYPGFNHKEQV